jgi:glycosyltransferase involved in cell wall biosynthesis
MNRNRGEGEVARVADAGRPDIELSIVMPCINEARTLPVCIRKAQEAIARHGLAAEIIVADNGSTDGSREIASELGARVVPIEARGYGAALSGGIAAARGRFVIMGDADDSYDFGEIFPFVEKLRQGDEMVMGCRLPSGGGTIMPGAMPLKNRLIGNPILSWIGRVLFRSHVKDFHCGMRGFRRDAILNLDLHTTGMEYASEMVIKAVVQGTRIGEIPITLHKDGRDRPPHLRPWRDGWRHLRFMLLMSPRWLFLLPGLLLLAAGAAGMAWLLPGPRYIGRICFDSTTLLVAAMVFLVGFQIVVYAIFARLFAITEGLLKPDAMLTRISNAMSLEGGIIAGLILFAGGLGLLGYAVWAWGQHGFGSVNAGWIQRLAIPALTAMVLGVQVVFSSFFVSTLTLSRR